MAYPTTVEEMVTQFKMIAERLAERDQQLAERDVRIAELEANAKALQSIIKERDELLAERVQDLVEAYKNLDEKNQRPVLDIEEIAAEIVTRQKG